MTVKINFWLNLVVLICLTENVRSTFNKHHVLKENPTWKSLDTGSLETITEDELGQTDEVDSSECQVEKPHTCPNKQWEPNFQKFPLLATVPNPDFILFKQLMLTMVNRVSGDSSKNENDAPKEVLPSLLMTLTAEQIQQIRSSVSTIELSAIVEDVIQSSSVVHKDSQFNYLSVGSYFRNLFTNPFNMDLSNILRTLIVTVILFGILHAFLRRWTFFSLFVEVFLVCFFWTWHNLLEDHFNMMMKRQRVHCAERSIWNLWSTDTAECEEAVSKSMKSINWAVTPVDVLVNMFGKGLGTLLGAFFGEFLEKLAKGVKLFLSEQSWFTWLPSMFLLIFILMFLMAMVTRRSFGFLGLNMGMNPAIVHHATPYLVHQGRYEDGHHLLNQIEQQPRRYLDMERKNNQLQIRELSAEDYLTAAEESD